MRRGGEKRWPEGRERRNWRGGRTKRSGLRQNLAVSRQANDYTGGTIFSRAENGWFERTGSGAAGEAGGSAHARDATERTRDLCSEREPGGGGGLGLPECVDTGQRDGGVF